jgi:signal transduction histidine kinase
MMSGSGIGMANRISRQPCAQLQLLLVQVTGVSGCKHYLACGIDAVRISVLDRGPGIPIEQREAVFRPFTRLETSRNRAGGGSGLGLAIARQLADAYGWRIELSARDGGGLSASLTIGHAGSPSSWTG